LIPQGSPEEAGLGPRKYAGTSSEGDQASYRIMRWTRSPVQASSSRIPILVSPPNSVRLMRPRAVSSGSVIEDTGHTRKASTATFGHHGERHLVVIPGLADQMERQGDLSTELSEPARQLMQATRAGVPRKRRNAAWRESTVLGDVFYTPDL